MFNKTNMLKLLMILSLVSTISSLHCGDGCLRCPLGTDCLMCNFMAENGTAYHKSGNSCVKSTIPNCVTFGINAGCLECTPGYFVAPNGLTCIENLSQIQGCLTYVSQGTCSECQAGRHLTNPQTCSEIASPINACLRHSNDFQKCLQCIDNFTPSLDRTVCEDPTNDDNCKFFNNYLCEKCDNLSVKDVNSTINYFYDVVLRGELNDVAVQDFTYNYNMYEGNGALQRSICVARKSPFCQNSETFDVCLECIDGYFLLDNDCFPNPPPTIEFCKKYEREFVCEECEQGYYRSSNICIEITAAQLLPGCAAYDGSATTVKCIECTDNTNFYADPVSGACVGRTNIPGCVTYSKTSDSCEDCGAQIPVINGTHCTTAINDCLKYTFDGSIKCEVCGNNSSPDNGGSCNGESLPSCVKADSSGCVECVPTHYVDSGVCVLRVLNNLPFCLDYTIDKDGSCSTCDASGSIGIEVQSGCQDITVVDGCLEYDSNGDCVKCNVDYEYDTNLKTCTQLTPGNPCKRVVDSDCTECNAGYEIENNNCVLINSIYTTNCDSNQLPEGDQEFHCPVCAEDKLPLSFNNLGEASFICHDSEIISNCIESVGNLCTKCATGFVLTESNQCTNTCLGTMVFGTILSTTISDSDTTAYAGDYIQTSKKCTNVSPQDPSFHQPSTATCKVYQDNVNPNPINPNRTLEKTCNLCIDNSVRVRDVPDRMVALPYDTTYYEVNDPNVVYAGANCEAITGGSLDIVGSSDKSTCEYFSYINNKAYCQKCVIGRTGMINADATSSYLDDCQTMSTCDRSVYYGGFNNDTFLLDVFGFNLDEVFSCHKCQASDQIPFIHINTDSEMKTYDITNVVPEGAVANGDSVVCRAPNQTGLVMTSNQFNSFVSNCAFGAYFVNLTKLSEIDNALSSVQCLACKDGYKPVYNESRTMITACVVISECDTSNPLEGWVNGCKNCRAGFAHKIDGNNVLITDECFPTADSNCEYINNSGDCVRCKNEYSFGYEGKCDKLTTAACSAMRPNGMVVTLPNKLQQSFFGLGFEKGCKSCPNGKFLAPSEKFTDFICVDSEFVTNQNFPAVSDFSTDCAKYTLNGSKEIVCYECDASFTITDDGDCKANLTNCEIANANGTCKTCSQNAVLNSTTNLCMVKTINLCIEYQTNTSSLICIRCQDEYYPVNGGTGCSAGGIPNCAHYQDSSTCLSCKSGTISYQGECRAFPSEVKCSTFNDKNECTSCKTSQQIIRTDDNQFHSEFCIAVPTPNQCIVIDTNNFGDCLECNSMFYVSNGQCALRTVEVLDCSVYALDDDACLSCKEGFFPSSNGLFCYDSSVEGIPFCAEYEDLVTCEVCTSFYFLEDGKCIAIPEADRIDECVKYGKNIEEYFCLECDTNFFLNPVDGLCITALTDCIHTTSPANGVNYLALACEECKAGFDKFTPASTVIRTGTGSFLIYELNSCIEYIPDPEDNCATRNINETDGVKCTSCNLTYYESSGACLPYNPDLSGNPDTISGCIEYLIDGCKKCESDKILTTSKTCLYIQEIADNETHCTEMKEAKVCAICDAGYRLDSTECSQCLQTTELVQPCMHCDASKSCLVCNKGYRMEYINEIITCRPDVNGVVSRHQGAEDSELSANMSVDLIKGLTGLVVSFLLLWG